MHIHLAENMTKGSEITPQTISYADKVNKFYNKKQIISMRNTDNKDKTNKHIYYSCY